MSDGKVKTPTTPPPTAQTGNVTPQKIERDKAPRSAERNEPVKAEKSETPQRVEPTKSTKVAKTREETRKPTDRIEPQAETNTLKRAAEIIQGRDDQQQQFIHQLRLAGTNIILQDRRSEFAERRGRHEHSEDHGRRDTREGRGAERAEGQGRRAGPSTGVESGLATALKKPHGGVESAEDVEARLALNAAKFGEKGERALSAFEKALVARFEKGEQQAADSEDGQFHFLKKTAAEWKGFFENFLSRTIQKVVTWGDVQGFLFRGLLQAKGIPQQGVMISDVMTAAGVDKFARIAVPLNKAQALAATLPGAMLTKEAMQSVVGEQLRYLALGAAPAEDVGAQLGRAASRGMFASQQLENRVAEHLGLVTDFRGAAMQGAARDAEEKRAATARHRRGGMWSKLFGGDDVEGEGSVFVHWWRWDREERTGFRRWFVAVFGAVIFVALFFLLIALVRALRP